MGSIRRAAPAIRHKFLSTLEGFSLLPALAKSWPLAVTFLCVLAMAQDSAAQQVQTLRQHVRPAVAEHRAPYVGPLASDDELHLAILLPLRNPSALADLLQRIYDPSSPDYRHFLSVAQFTEQFGPTEADYKAVEAYAVANGLKVGEEPANRMLVPVSGSVAKINTAFAVQMNVYQHPTEKRTFYSPDREPSLRLGVTVSHISGLDDYSLPQPLSVRPQDSQQPQVSVNGSGPGGSYLGSDMRAAYYGGHTLDGTGQAIALLEYGGYNLSDVNSTFSNAGQTYTVPINNVLLDGSTGAVNTAYGDGEQVLDIVQAIGMAPGLSQVRVYIGTGSDDANILNSMASENIARQISCSWSWVPVDPGVDEPIFQEMAAQGQSFFAASGDDGAFDLAVSKFVYPQEDPYVTAVGGTHLTTTSAAGSWASETVWNSGGGGSGGGISPDSLPIPSWQSGLANSANGGSSVLRNSPDVAMEGDFDNYNCQSGVCKGTWAGTSFAAPRWAGFMALVNQQAVEAGNAPAGGIGFVNPALYQIAKGANADRDLHDVTSGNNLTANQPIWFSAVAGYDLTTGLGSANGQSLIDDLAGPQIPGFWLAPSQSNVTVNPGGTASTTIRITDAGGFTGNVTLSITSTLPTGVTASFGTNPATGSSLLTFAADASTATQSIKVTVTGMSGSLTQSTSFTLAVHPPSFTLSSSPSALTIAPTASGSSTVTVTPLYGFTGIVSFAASGLPAGVTASFTPATTTSSSVVTLTGDGTELGGTFPITITGTSGTITASTTVALTVTAPSFQLYSYGSVTAGQGSTGSGYVSIQSLNSFTGSVTLAASNLPAGVMATFSPNPTSVSSNVVFSVSSSAAPGSSLVTISGTSGGLKASTTLTLTIVVPTFTLNTGGSISLGQNSTASSYVSIYPQNGFSTPVTLSISGLPSGVTALITPNPAAPYSSGEIYLASTAAAKAGQYPLTITGTSGSQKVTTTLTLTVYAPTFTLASYTSLQIAPGTSGTSSLNLGSQYGFSGSVNLSVSGLPAGVTAFFSPNPSVLTANSYGSSTLTVQASATAAPGQYSLTVTGTSGGQTVTTTVPLTIATPSFQLSGGGYVTMGQGGAGSTYISISSLFGFNSPVNLSVSGLPAGVTATFSPNPATYSSAINLQASSSTPVGQYTLTITGTSGSLTSSTTMSLGIYSPTFTLSANGSLSVGQGSTAQGSVYVSDIYGFSTPVTLSATGLPAGVTATFATNPTTQYSTPLTLAVGSSVAPGQYPYTISGTAGGQTMTTSATLTVVTPSFTISTGGSVYVGQGSTTTTYVYPSYQGGFNSPLPYTISGLPSGVTASFSPNPTNGTATLTLTVAPSAAVASSTLTVTGTSGSLTATAPLTLSVMTPTFTMYGGSTAALNQGSSETATVYITPQYGFTGNVSLSVTGLPSGVTGSFSQNPTTSTSVLTLTAAANATPGTSNFSITGTSGSATYSNTFQVTVNAGSFTLATAPADVTLYPASAGKSTISIAPVNNFAGPVTLSVSGLPAGVTASFSPATTSSASTITFMAGSTASAGPSTVTITGTSGSLTAATTVAINVVSAQTMTTTTLALTTGGSAVTSVSSGTLVTATATVMAGSTPQPTGQVYLCDATASYCDSSHQLAAAQITSAGIASFSFLPGIGARSYKAIFAGTVASGASASAASPLTVNGILPTTTTIAQSGSAGSYTLTATVAGQGDLAPTGQVSFLDTSNANRAIVAVPLKLASSSATLKSSQQLNLGFQPGVLLSSDFNGDGIPDLAVPNGANSAVSILLGTGNGTVTAGTSLPIGSAVQALAAGDFNHDGHVDLAVLVSSIERVLIFLGNGDGTFTASPAFLPTPGSPNAMAVADFNNDGFQDIAITNTSNSTVTVLLGNGDGTFTPSIFSSSTGGGAYAITSADFDGDGIADLAVANNYYSGSVAILLGNGDGSFTGMPLLASNAFSTLITVGDFNQDGIPDLVVGSSNSVAQVFLGNGDGTFASGTNLVSGTTFNSMAVADVNGDGKQDIVATNSNGLTTTVLLGKGDGTFASGPTFTATNSPTSVAIGDWNKDGIPDIAFSSVYGSSLSILSVALAQTSTATASGISPIGTGLHLVEASYPGDTSYQGSTSNTVTLTGETAAPAVTVTPASLHIGTTQALTVNVTVSGGVGNPVPTGSVTLTSGSYTSSAITLNSGAAAFSIPVGTLSAGVDTLAVSYTPDSSSTSDYSASTGSATVAVGTLTPTVGVTLSSSSIQFTDLLTVSVAVTDSTGFGTPTGTVTLTGGGFVSAATTVSSGAATIQIPAGALAAGVDTLTVTYTPDTSGASVYVGASGQASVTVGTAKPAITWTTPAAITYGTALSSTQLNASSSVAGTFAYSPAAGTVLGAGSQMLSVTFTPTDSTDYASATSTVTLTVNKATPTITWATPAAISYGTALSSTQLDASSPVAGSFAYSPAAGTVLAVGTQTLSATFTPTDAADYVSATATTTLMVNASAVAITWATPSAITYGAALSAAQLNATANVPGTFSYSPAAGAVLAAGPQTLTATFTPTDTTDYRASTASVVLNVNKAPLTIAAASFSRTYGTANPTFTGTVNGAVNGDSFTESFATTATTASPAGTYAIVPAVTGANAADYAVSATNGTLTISPAATTTALVLSNQNLTFTATVASATSGTATGTVSFYAGTTLLGTGSLVSGVATYTATTFPSGNVAVSAQYGGDTNFATSSSAATLVLAMSLANASLNVPTAGTVTDNVTLNVPAGYAGSVQLSCTGLPQYASCSSQPTSVTFGGSTSSSSITLTIGTGGLANLTPPPSPWLNKHEITWAGLLGLPGLLALGLARRRKEARAALRLLGVLLLLSAAATQLVGCGGNSGGSSGPTQNKTPAGSYTVQVTASGPSGASQSANIALTVQ